ncbi:hypothetical protein VP1G_00685 [Cytospora mali]|uniref:Luciferase domain-containing protein n=1 Tax=Cytospora mali TaxID=578113 RepID=A0A194UNI7_CYTMA|nr:hypothetical protein VP1G_00685 [Valsa mali var. pyri (nom. inval.)]
MASSLQNPHLERALFLVRTYVPDTVRDNWRIYGTTAIMIGLALCPVVAWAMESYQTYLDVGPGGLPHNIFGWILQGAAQLIARHDIRDHKPFSDPSVRQSLEPHGTTSFLRETLPIRKGERPVVPGFVAPQRQMSDRGPRNAVMKQRLIGYQAKIAEANSSLLFNDESRLEGRGTPALWFAVSRDRSIPTYLKKTKGEFAHVHPEATMHVTLSLVDAEEVVRKGWGERHPLSGVKGFWPLSYVFVYAPRDDAELEVCKEVLEASVRFICAGGPQVQL